MISLFLTIANSLNFDSSFNKNIALPRGYTNLQPATDFAFVVVGGGGGAILEWKQIKTTPTF